MTRGKPRIQYQRTYVLLPPSANSTWSTAVINATWEVTRWTLGGSADDSAIGDLDNRRIIAVNPQLWPTPLTQSWFDEHYPGVTMEIVTAATPDDLEERLHSMISPPPSNKLLLGFNDPDNQGAGTWMMQEGIPGLLYVPLFIGYNPDPLDFSAYEVAGIRVIVNLRHSWSVDMGGSGTLPPLQYESDFIDACVRKIQNSYGVWGWTITNEANNPREWPANEVISPFRLAAVYNRIAEQVPDVRLSPGALDPFNSLATWNPREYMQFIYEKATKVDFIDVHGYIRGPDHTLLWSDAKFSDDPMTWQYLNAFGCFDTLLAVLPDRYANLPIYISEYNHLFVDVEPNWGWVNDQRAASVVSALPVRVADYNHTIAGIGIYRWKGDDWHTGDNSFVLNAVKEHYE